MKRNFYWGFLLALIVPAIFLLLSCGGGGGSNGDSSSISIVSVNSVGTEGNGGSYRPAITPDGRYVVFDSRSTDLVAADTNDYRDIFVRDMELGITSLVSVSTAGAESNEDSFSPGPSFDGRYVVFESRASNLVPDDTNLWHDIFLRDMDLGITSRLSVSTAGTQGNSFSQLPVISVDGRFVAFMSSANNLVADDSNNEWDIFVRDVVQGITSRISESTAGTEGNDKSTWPAINSDGRYVVFESNASNLVPDDNNDTYDIFVRDTDLGITSRVSVSTAGTEGDNGSFNPAISSDGRYVVFMSQATNLVVGDTNGYDDVFIHDMDLGITSRISVSTAGTEGNEHSGHDDNKPAISSDGRYVAFTSKASNLVPDDTNGIQDIFVHDMTLGSTSRASARKNAESDANCWCPAISADGKYVAFESKASNLIYGKTIPGGNSQVYIKTRQ